MLKGTSTYFSQDSRVCHAHHGSSLAWPILAFCHGLRWIDASDYCGYLSACPGAALTREPL